MAGPESSEPRPATGPAINPGAPRVVVRGPTAAGTNGSADQEQFAALLEGSRTALWCIAAAITGDRHLAHDAVQEASMIALAKYREFDPHTNFAAWAGQIVRFVALNLRRKRQRDRAVESPGAGGAAAARAAPAQGGFDARVLRALDGIDDTPRTCLLMRVLMDMSYREIAAALDIPEGTAMSHVHRARASLRARLGDHALPSPGATT